MNLIRMIEEIRNVADEALEEEADDMIESLFAIIHKCENLIEKIEEEE